MRIDAHIPRPSKPVEAVEPFRSPRYCSCGLEMRADDRHDMAAQWYGHLADVVVSDPDGQHSMDPF